MKVKNRYELYNKFNDIMNSVYVNRRDEQKQNYNQNMVKTYLLEGHINENSNPSHDDFMKFFREYINSVDHEIEFNETEDEYLFQLLFNDVEFFLDAEVDRRFFMLHTSEKTERSDKELSHLIKEMPNFDNIWLTRKMMLLTNEFASWRGVTLKHEELDINDLKFEPDSLNLKANTSESRIKNLIELLNGNNDFYHSTGIYRLRLKSQEKDITTRILDDLRYDGKFSTRGNSFNRHLWLVNKIYSEYKKLINNIEKHYTISFNKGTLEGLPINIEFKRNDLNVKYIIETIFSHKKPFRLWGFPEKISDDYYKVYAVDLHNGNKGNKINFEVSSNFITVYLPSGNCGNTIARLICNIQRYLDSQVSVWGGNDDDLF